MKIWRVPGCLQGAPGSGRAPQVLGGRSKVRPLSLEDSPNAQKSAVPESPGRFAPAACCLAVCGQLPCCGANLAGAADAAICLAFFLAASSGYPNSPPRPGEAPHPAPSARKSVIRLHRKLPSVPPGSTQEVSESENRPATRGTAHSEVQGDDRGND